MLRLGGGGSAKHGNLVPGLHLRKLQEGLENGHWESAGEAQHARCTTCAELCKSRSRAKTQDGRTAFGKAYVAHLQLMFQDRRLDMRLTYLSEISCGPACPVQGVLHVRIDAMDHATFRVPRNLTDANMWSDIWRPQLHVVGVLVEGCMECYVLCDQELGSFKNGHVCGTEVSCRSCSVLRVHGLSP